MGLHELLKGCEKSDSDAQRDLFVLFKNALMGICVRYSKNNEQAEEMLKKGFVNIFNSIKNLPAEDQLESWLKSKMVDTAIEVLRSNKQEYKIVSTANAYDGIGTHDKINDQEVIRSMDNKDVIKAIQALTPAFRVVVNLHLVDGYSTKQVSDRLDVGEATIKLNFDKAMYQLRRNIVQLTTVSHAE